MLNPICFSSLIIVSSTICICFALERILGGRPAMPGEYPMMAGIIHAMKEQHRCGAIIVGPRYLLTAAHCLRCGYSTSCARVFRVIVGDVNQRTTDDEPISRQILDIKTSVIHAQYEHATYENDIGIIELLKEVQPSMYVQAARLIGHKIPPGTECTTIGWGVSHEEQNDKLLATSVKILNDNVCHKNMISFKDPMMICAGDLTGKNDSCIGDSGGPLICGNLVVGIVSFGINCALPGYGAAYTNVSYYNKWVKRQLALLDGLSNGGIDKLAISIKIQFLPTLCLIICIYR